MITGISTVQLCNFTAAIKACTRIGVNLTSGFQLSTPTADG